MRYDPTMPRGAKANQHTPGPWQVLPEEMGRNYLRVRGTLLGLRYKIADVRNPDYDGVTEKDAEMTRANARLIAAAPELLEALQRMVDTYEHEASAENPSLLNAKALLERIA